MKINFREILMITVVVSSFTACGGNGDSTPAATPTATPTATATPAATPDTNGTATPVPSTDNSSPLPF